MQALTALSLNEKLQAGEALQIVDVREAVETTQGMLPGALHIPLGELPERHTDLSPARPTVVYCHHGARSARAVQHLMGLGFVDVSNLIGGCDAWSRQVDPTLPLY